MTVLIGGVATTVMTAGQAGRIEPAGVIPAAYLVTPGGTLAAVAAVTGLTTTATAVAGSAGIGASVGAIAGAAFGGTPYYAVSGAVVGLATSAGITSAGAGLSVLAAGGSVGWLVLGTEHHNCGATFDCWKPVVRDNSTNLSDGKLLKDIFEDQRIKRIIVQESRNNFYLPEISLVNIWDEQFDISYLVLPSNNQLVAHAVRVA